MKRTDNSVIMDTLISVRNVKEVTMNNQAMVLTPEANRADMQDYIKSFIEKNSINVIKMGTVDIDGLWRGKRLSADHFLKSVYESGSNICNIIFGWDMQDEMITNLTYTGFQTGYPDITLQPDLSTMRVAPDEPGVALVIADALDLQGNPLNIAPRSILKEVVSRARSMGYDPIAAYEFEFYLYEGTPRENARKGWRDMEPFSVGTH